VQEVSGVGTVVDKLRERAARDPDAPFVHCTGEWVSAAELAAVTDRVAAGLFALGIREGDRVALILPNRNEFLELYFALAKLGAIQVPLNYWLKGEFLRYQLNDSGARVLIADAPGVSSAVPIVQGTAVERIVHVDALDPTVSVAAIAYQEVRACTTGFDEPEHRDSAVQSILYTSGTTGAAKGCMLPYGYYAAAGIALGQAELVIPGDTVFTAFPLFHAGGQAISLTAALMNDAAVHYEPEFSASQFMPRAAAAGATMLWGVGPMGMAILATPETPADRDNVLRLAAFVPMPPAQQAVFEERFGVPFTSEMYGQTECQPVTASPPSGPRSRGSLGLPAPHLEVRVVDDDDRSVAPGEVGEIVLRPREPNAMFCGYWGKPEASVEAARNYWHHTGDLGVADADGFITFVDRKKDALRRRGENVSSFELEAAIAKHPAVAQCAVCAVPSPLGEDDIKACLVLVPDGRAEPPSPEELFEYFKSSVPYFAIPRYVEIRDSLPLTAATGRVMKHVLRDEGVTDATWDFEQLTLVVPKAERRG
jgi:crotonobetaine/carnitine-CoA ligase